MNQMWHEKIIYDDSDDDAVQKEFKQTYLIHSLVREQSFRKCKVFSVQNSELKFLRWPDMGSHLLLADNGIDNFNEKDKKILHRFVKLVRK